MEYWSIGVLKYWSIGVLEYEQILKPNMVAVVACRINNLIIKAYGTHQTFNVNIVLNLTMLFTLEYLLRYCNYSVSVLCIWNNYSFYQFFFSLIYDL